MSKTDALRTVDLPDGRVLHVRAVTAADVDALMALYAGLDVEDLHFRFFSAFHPPREFFDKWARVEERGGFGVVADVTDGQRHRIVGEAAYALLPDGDGEFAIAIAPDWRGWLGPYLLDTLVEAAAARGVPNLQADILLDNRRMLALVRARGYAVLDHPDWTIVRVAIGATQRTPTWPPVKERRRLLVEATGARWRGEAAAKEAGWDVALCPGPRTSGQSGRGIKCPVLDGRPCPLAEGADAIAFSLPPGTCEARRILEAHADGIRPVLVLGESDRFPAIARNAPLDEILAALDDLIGADAVRP